MLFAAAAFWCAVLQHIVPQRNTMRGRSSISSVHDDVLQEGLLEHLEAQDLCRMAQVSRRFRSLAGTEKRWRSCYKSRFSGEDTRLVLEALKLAQGSWKSLYAAKAITERQAAPWRKPSSFELSAAINFMTLAKQQHSSQELAVVFLVDGSGSVGEEDFACMTEFIRTAADAIEALDPSSKVAVVQFSNDVKVEVPLQALDKAALDTAITDMVRINGGTNIAAAVQKAGQLLKASAAPDALRRLVLLTDGRIDSYQSREAAAMVSRLADEQSCVELYAFGVGRGVDKGELVRIIQGALCVQVEVEVEVGVEEEGKKVEGSGEGEAAKVPKSLAAEERYVELCVRDEAPW